MAGGQPLEPRLVSLSLPKFEITSEVPLRETFEALRMTDAFDPAVADLSGMDGTRTLFVDNVYHQGFISVDEEGTEAAATTAVMVAAGSALAEPEPLEIRVDRPFIWLIRDVATGTALFIGQVVDPGA